MNKQPFPLIHFHSAASLHESRSKDTCGRMTRAQKHTCRLSCDVGPKRSQAASCVHTHQFSPSLVLFREAQTATWTEKRERGRKGRNGVWEKWEEEGGPGISSAKRSSLETGDELQKWDLRQMPSFSKELRHSAPRRTQWLERGEVGLCQAHDLSRCMCVFVCRVALGHKPCHRTWPWGAAIRLPICWVKYRCCIRAEGLQLAPIKQVCLDRAAVGRAGYTGS